MFNVSKKIMIATATIALSVTACTEVRNDYSTAVSSETSANWNVSSVEIAVPKTLSVSEDNLYMPNADIVWRAEPYGDRRAQVDAIVTEGVSRGASVLHGNRSVRIEGQVTAFHALSEKARKSVGGVHNVAIILRVVDVRTGEILVPNTTINADLEAYAGKEAADAMRQGKGQKYRITNHIAAVVRTWLGAATSGEVVEQSVYSKLGR